MRISAEEQIAKYEAWAEQLQQNLASMARQRRWSWAYLGVSVVVGAGTWPLHHFLAGSALTLGIILWATSLYITLMRTSFYGHELARTRAELERLIDSARS